MPLQKVQNTGHVLTHPKHHEKLKVLFTITRNITQELGIDRLLSLIMDEVKKALNCDRCAVFLLDKEKNELWSRAAHGNARIRFPKTAGIAGHVATTGRILNIPDVYSDHRFNPDIDRQTGYVTRNILAVPLRNNMGSNIGVFQALNKFGGPFTNEDEELLNAISVISASQLENARLYEEQKKTFDSFIETLASTIDARDPLTAGHSKRIALYADEIAQILNLSDQEREVLRTAALLHDFGKIGVREAILTKNGALTDEEYKQIQHHPRYTRTILEKINFTRELGDVPLIASSHHERLDGSGYPVGLRDNEIPMLSKIIAVADVFDALTSKRHYRTRMNFFRVMDILSQDTGTAFDEFVVAAFKKIKLDRIVAILEMQNSDILNESDLNFLQNFSISDIVMFNNNDSTNQEQQEVIEIFIKYYSKNIFAGLKK